MPPVPRSDDYALLLRGEITSEEYVRRLNARAPIGGRYYDRPRVKTALETREAVAEARKGRPISFPQRVRLWWRKG